MVVDSLKIEHKDILDCLSKVTDPEIPVLSILDMGILRDIKVDGKTVLIDLSPTYTGCPAMDMIASDIAAALMEIGFATKIKLVLSPPWTTNCITEEGRKALEEYGIASPLESSADKQVLLGNARLVKCPICSSQNTQVVSQFGSTACKALFKCLDCQEPFDYFKCLK